MIASSRARRAGAPHARHRQPLEHVRERQHHHPERFHDAGERLAHLRRLRLDVGVEQRLADDREREPVHLPGDVQRGAVGPRVPHPIRVRHHRAAVAGDPIAVKRRLHQAALAQVHGALARQQPFAEQALRALQPAALDEVLVVRDEDVADVLRAVDEEDRFAAHPVGHDVAVRAREVRVERERVAARPIDQRAEQRGLRSGRRGGQRRRHGRLVRIIACRESLANCRCRAQLSGRRSVSVDVALDVLKHLHQRGRREELAVVLRALHRELHQEVFVDAPEHIAGGGAERRAVEDAQQISEKVAGELVVVLGELSLQRLEVALDRVHRLDDGRAEVCACGEREQRVVARFRRKLEGAPLEEVALDQRPLRHRAGGLVSLDLTDRIVVPIGRVAQEDHAQHGHAVFAAGELGIGPEVVRGGPEIGFELVDTVHGVSRIIACRAVLL